MSTTTPTPDIPPIDKAHLRVILDGWARHRWLRPLDLVFADFLWREAPDAPPLLILAAALASHQLGRGHACLDLATLLADPGFALSLPPESGEQADEDPPRHPALVLAGLTLATWQAALAQPTLVGQGPGVTPLVLDEGRLYLRRYWDYEQAVARGIRTRLERTPAVRGALSVPALRQTLDRLFPGGPASTPDWQKLACALAAGNAISVITGGPGTGKTTTVVRLLAVLQALALAATAPGQTARPLRIRLAAPTGKAAARLNASIAGTVEQLPLAGFEQAQAIRAAIPITVTTLHRLLGSRPDTRRLRHNADNPLALDLLVIDEASMVDLEMMAAVLAALPPAARLILIGDKDQLASVEAGAVLGELCQQASAGRYQPETADWLAAACGVVVPPGLIDATGTALNQAVVMLRHSHRFAADSGIGQLAEAVNAGDQATILAIGARPHADLDLVPLADTEDPAFRSVIIAGRGTAPGYRHYLEVLRQHRPAADAGQAAYDDWARTVLEAHAGFQVLCALRGGPWGVEGLNPRIARLLQAAGLLTASSGWYLGRPVLVTRNDYDLGVMNGDIGITLTLPCGAGCEPSLRVAFLASNAAKGVKWLHPSRLQEVETVYALTVHKSQGSEFTHVALVMPDQPSQVLTRELLYTGITRARDHLTLLRPGSAGVMTQAVARRVLRATGLMKGLR